MTAKVFYLISMVLLATVIISGCGEQDLYKPPQSDYSIAGSIVLPSQALDVDILGHYAYVANSQGGLQVIDISDPSNPVVAAWSDTPKNANGIIANRFYDENGVARDLAFVLEGTEGAVAFDISDPLNPINLNAGIGAYDAKSICVAKPANLGDRYMMYMADSWRAIVVLATDPANPAILDQRYRATPLGYCKDLVPSEDNTHLYVVEDEMGIAVYDISQAYERTMPRIGNVDTPGYAYGVALSGDFLFVADKHGGMHSYHIGEDYLPELIATIPLTGDPEKIRIHNGVAFLAADDAGLHVVDVRDPYHPVLLGSVPTMEAIDVAVSENGVVCIADKDYGLVVFQGPALENDITAPAAVTELATHLIDQTSVTLSWKAPGDDNDEGTAAVYQIYQSDGPISTDNLGEANQLIRRPFPQTAGTIQSFNVTNLAAGSTTYFAMTATDEAGNSSDLSMNAVAVMTLPTLTAGLVDPTQSEIPDIEFTFTVIYTDGEGDAPIVSDLILDGETYPMTAESGDLDYTSGVTFEAKVVVGRGTHYFQFAFDDGHGPLVLSELYFGPITPSDPFEFDWIDFEMAGGKTFDLGSSDAELGHEADETQHSVTLTKDFSMAAIEVTQGVYNELMARNPSAMAGDLRPVERVTWFDAVAFCNAYSIHDGLTEAYTMESVTTEPDGRIISAIVTWNKEANGYRLPTEAEWEYACRAGSITSLATGDLTNPYCDSDPLLDQLGWFCGNSDTGFGPSTHDVASLDPNADGLYDMHGNVWEWCWDTYAEYGDSAVTDPSGPEGQVWEMHLRRGGSWYYYARDCRSASRDPFWPGSADNTLGFRVVRNLN